MLPLARNELTQHHAKVFAESVASKPGAKWLLTDRALIDPGKSERLTRSLGWCSKPAFDGSPLDVFGANGPQLIAVPDLAASDWELALQKWLALDPTGAGLSVICSPSSDADVSSALRYLALATVDDDLSLHCRCADARVLVHLLPILGAPQAARLKGTIDSWWWWDAQGMACSWTPDQAGNLLPDSAVSIASDHLQLSNAQYAEMMDRSEPDIMFSLLMDQTSELVPETGRGDFRVGLQRILEVATQYAVTQTPDRLQFVVLSLATGESFHQHPALKAMWQRIRAQSASLSQEMKAWSDELWADLDHGRRPAQ